MPDFSMQIKTGIAIITLTLMISSCSMAPKYQQPNSPVGNVWPDNGLGIATVPASMEMISWQQFVSDPALRRLVEIALKNNRDLRVATLNIEKARAVYKLNGAGPLPTLNLELASSRQSINNGDSITSSYRGSALTSAWELDFWGRLASLTEKARSELLSTAYAREAVQTSLIANVITSWVNMQTAGAMVDLTERTLKTRRETQQLIQRRVNTGVDSALDLTQAVSLTAAAETTLAQKQRDLAQARNALALLVGTQVPPDLLVTKDIPMDVFAEIPAGLPSDLLLRRPDIQSQEWVLKAANANIGAARAAFFPRIALTASAGSMSTRMSDLFSGGTFAWSFSPQALLPIFDAGRNIANLRITKVQREIEVANYEKVIQTAFTEVADTLAAKATSNDLLRSQEALVRSEAERAKLADMRQRTGVSSFLDVLDAQRSLFSAQQNLIQIRAGELANNVKMFRVLGGGWDQASTQALANQSYFSASRPSSQAKPQSQPQPQPAPQQQTEFPFP